MLEPPIASLALQCVGCQRALRPGARFCPGCGHTLSQSAAPPERSESSGAPGHFAAHWRELKRVGWLFVLLLSGSFVASLVSRVQAPLCTEAVLGAVDAVIILGFAAARHRELLPLLRRPALDLRGGLQLLSVAGAFILCMSAYFKLLESAGLPMIRYSEQYQRAGWPLWSAFLLISAMPAVFEEVAFRGVIQTSLERVLQTKEAWLIQAALFSVLHVTPIVFPSHFIMGLCFGWMRLRSRSLYPGMLLHAGWNALVLCAELRG